MKSLILSSLFLAHFLVPAVSFADPVPRVDNGLRPTQTIRNWHLQEQWRAGPEGDGFLFGSLVDLAVDEAGNTYLLDYQQQETYVFDPAGKFLFVRGRQGEGPGETTMAGNLLLGPDRFGLLNRFPAQIVWLDSQGDPAGSVQPFFPEGQEGFLGSWFGRLRHGRIVLAMTRSIFDGQIKANLDILAGCSFDGALTTVYVDFGETLNRRDSSDGVVDEGRMYDPLVGRWDLDEKGRLWIAPERDRYLLRVYDASGAPVLEVTREFAGPPRTPAARKKVRQSLEKKWRKSGLPIAVGDHAPCIGSLWIMENPWGTEVWVESSASHHDLGPGVMVRYDLFNLDGEFTHQVDIVGDGDPLFDKWYLVGKNRLLMVRNASPGSYADDDLENPRFDDGELEVISYRIVWEE